MELEGAEGLLILINIFIAIKMCVLYVYIWIIEPIDLVK